MSGAPTILTRPPFAVVESLSPPEVGAGMVDCFKQIGARSDRLEHAHALALCTIGLPDTDPVLRAGRAIARDIDRGVGAGVAEGYHNAQHFLEVMLTALYLARLVLLDARRTARVVTAALMHDFHHDGSRSTAAPFRLELIALREAQPYLLAAGVDDGECSRLQALVLATEPHVGVQFARACWKQLSAGMPAAQPAPTLPPQLGRLAIEPQLAHEAVLLAEADVLPSIGMTFEHGEQLQSKLASEWGTTLGSADKLHFIERMLENISVSGFFLPNIRTISEAYRR